MGSVQVTVSQNNPAIFTLRKVVCLILVANLLLFQCALAEGSDSERTGLRFSYVQSVHAGLLIVGSTAYCEGMGRGMYEENTTYLLVALQRRPSDGGLWYTIAHWNTTSAGTSTAVISETYGVTSGYSYRVMVRCRIKDSEGNLLETVYEYSPVWNL